MLFKVQNVLKCLSFNNRYACLVCLDHTFLHVKLTMYTQPLPCILNLFHVHSTSSLFAVVSWYPFFTKITWQNKITVFSRLQNRDLNFCISTHGVRILGIYKICCQECIDLCVGLINSTAFWNSTCMMTKTNNWS